MLRQEHEFLGKAAAFFAKESARGAPWLLTTAIESGGSEYEPQK